MFMTRPFDLQKQRSNLLFILSGSMLFVNVIVKKTVHTVKPVLSGHSKIDKTKVLKTNGSLMKVKSIAECSLWSILQF